MESVKQNVRSQTFQADYDGRPSACLACITCCCSSFLQILPGTHPTTAVPPVHPLTTFCRNGATTAHNIIMIVLLLPSARSDSPGTDETSQIIQSTGHPIRSTAHPIRGSSRPTTLIRDHETTDTLKIGFVFLFLFLSFPFLL